MYITEIIKKNATEYGFYVGPRIEAASWTEAEKKAQELGVELIGELEV
jgi:hypothetical protein